MIRNRKKGRFISQRAFNRGLSSSDRLKTWHEFPESGISVLNQTQTDTEKGTQEERSFSDTAFQSDVALNGPIHVGAEEEVVDAHSVISGRRIVELDHIMNQLHHCIQCNNELNIINTKREHRYGFGSVLTVVCATCGCDNKIDTNKRHRHEESHKGPKGFSINTKAALGMIHSGLGYTHINNFMSAIEVPAAHHKTIRKLESKVGLHVRSLAKKSCTAAIKQEADATRKCKSSTTTSASNDSRNESGTVSVEIGMQLTAESSSLAETSIARNVPTSEEPLVLSSSADEQECCVSENSLITKSNDLDHSYITTSQPVHAAFKYDMGWQKRGSGRSYDSKSGVGTVIGNQTGKICAYDIRCKTCKLCEYHKHKGDQIPKHDCCKNWTGSSKSMEPDVGGQLVKEIEKENVLVGVMVMDDDCTTIARIKQELSHDVQKWSDQNHTVKHLGNNLYSLQKKHKALSTMVIKHIQKCFNYALAQNKGNVEKFKSALSQVVPHLFGEHDSCGSWCGYVSSVNPEHYKHKGFPHGQPLSGESLRADLDAVLNIFIRNASKIAPGGSTKDVESVNNMVATKAPKRIHYSSSDSLMNRVSCVVAQKNIGCTYVNEVNSFEKRARKLDCVRKRRQETEQSVTFKRRRLERKLSQKFENARKEVKEGITYQSGIGNSLITEVTEIPKPETMPVLEKIEVSVIANSQKVFCDIETSSLHKKTDIVQIAAVCGDDSFNQYILPEKNIAPSASSVTGLEKHDGKLFYFGRRVDTVALKEALQLFLVWLDSHQPCILIGHNFQKFDFPRMFHSFEISGLAQGFESRILGIVDTLPLFRSMFKKLERYSQQYLFTYFVKEQYSAHNALSDVQSLDKLCKTAEISIDNMSEFSWSTHYAAKLYHYYKAGDDKVHSLLYLQQKKALTKTMADKIANSGLSLQHLKFAANSGIEALSQVLSEDVNGKPRVTKCRRIIENVYNAVK